MKLKILTKEMYADNIVGVKVNKEERLYPKRFGKPVYKIINRTKYLKICWFCGQYYESHKHNSYSCSLICGQNIIRQRKAGSNFLVDMETLKKPKNTKEEREKRGYR